MSLLERGNTRLAPLETVESLLAENRKQVLQEAIDWFDTRYFHEFYGHDVIEELRRMAESDKTTMEGEKSEQ